MSTPSASLGRLRAYPISGGQFPEGLPERPVRKLFNPQIILCILTLRWPRRFPIPSLPTLFLPMLKKILLRSSFCPIGRSLICALALGSLSAMPRSLVDEESTNYLAHCGTVLVG